MKFMKKKKNSIKRFKQVETLDEIVLMQIEI